MVKKQTVAKNANRLWLIGITCIPIVVFLISVLLKEIHPEQIINIYLHIDTVRVIPSFLKVSLILSSIMLGINAYRILKCNQPKKYLWISISILLIFLFLFVAIPTFFIPIKSAPFEATKSNMASIAYALEQYNNKYGTFPDPFENRYPASKDGILVREGVIRSQVCDPISNGNYIYIYNEDIGVIEILCPNPDYYKQYIRRKNPEATVVHEIKYNSEKGIVIDFEKDR